MREPVLAERTLTGHYDRFIRVYGGLHYIKGNNKPYFTITADTYKAGGCQHDSIQDHLGNRFDDLIALHLSDIDGVPMHPVDNGFYFYTLAKDDPKYIEVLAEHLRITMEDAKDLRHMNLDKDAFRKVVDEQRPRWKVEAMACIAKHKLVVFGDRWENE